MYCLSWKEMKSNKRSSGGVNDAQVVYMVPFVPVRVITPPLLLLWL